MRSRLLLTTALASSVWFPVHAADFSTPLPHLALPAVDGFNGKVDAFFGANRYRTFLGRESEGGMSRSMLKIAVRALPRLRITRPLMSHQGRSGWRDDVAVRRAGWAVGHGLSTA